MWQASFPFILPVFMDLFKLLLSKGNESYADNLFDVNDLRQSRGLVRFKSLTTNLNPVALTLRHEYQNTARVLYRYFQIKNIL